MNWGNDVLMGLLPLEFPAPPIPNFVLVPGNFYVKKEGAIKRACSLVASKGIINIGSGWSVSPMSKEICQLPQVLVNVDCVNEGPKIYVANLENAYLPYDDKTFDVSFASHVFEHINNWQAALKEWIRISDHTILVLPNPMSMGQVMHKDHKRYVSYEWINEVSQFPSVEVFY